MPTAIKRSDKTKIHITSNVMMGVLQFHVFSLIKAPIAPIYNCPVHSYISASLPFSHKSLDVSKRLQWMQMRNFYNHVQCQTSECPNSKTGRHHKAKFADD